MTNDGLKAFLAEYGDAVCVIQFDNNARVYIGYPSSTLKTVDDIQYGNFGGVDMVGIPKDSFDPKLQRKGVSCVLWHVTAFIQEIVVVTDEKYRMDPMEIG